MSEHAKVIIVMPAYNAAETLVDTYKRIPPEQIDRVILVDDGCHAVESPPLEPDSWDDEWVPDPWADAEGAEDDPDIARPDDLED